MFSDGTAGWTQQDPRQVNNSNQGGSRLPQAETRHAEGTNMEQPQNSRFQNPQFEPDSLGSTSTQRQDDLPWKPDPNPPAGVPNDTSSPSYDPINLVPLSTSQPNIESIAPDYPYPMQYPTDIPPSSNTYPYPSPHQPMFDFSMYPGYPDLTSGQPPRSNRDWHMSAYPYPPPEQPFRDQPELDPNLDAGPSRRWQGVESLQFPTPSESAHSHRPPILPTGYYPPHLQTPGQYPTPSTSYGPDPSVRSPRPSTSTSTSGPSTTSTETRTRTRSVKRRSSSMADDDEDDAGDRPESEEPQSKLDKRRDQNKLAQRAFRARTRVQNVKISSDMAQLTELTQSQAKRLEDMTALVATLQRENQQLKMAASRHKSGTEAIPRDAMAPPDPAVQPGPEVGESRRDQVKSKDFAPAGPSSTSPR